MKSYLLIFIFLLSNYSFSQIKNANCAEYDNSRVRCLAKKRCKWKPGVGPGKGFCLYQDLDINKEEMEIFQESQKLKIKCADEQNNYKALEESLERATIYQDTMAIKSLSEKIKLKKMEILKITGCELPKSIAQQKREQEIELTKRREQTNQQKTNLNPIKTPEADIEPEEADDEDSDE